MVQAGLFLNLENASFSPPRSNTQMVCWNSQSEKSFAHDRVNQWSTKPDQNANFESLFGLLTSTQRLSCLQTICCFAKKEPLQRLAENTDRIPDWWDTVSRQLAAETLFCIAVDLSKRKSQASLDTDAFHQEAGCVLRQDQPNGWKKLLGY